MTIVWNVTDKIIQHCMYEVFKRINPFFNNSKKNVDEDDRIIDATMELEEAVQYAMDMYHIDYDEGEHMLQWYAWMNVHAYKILWENMMDQINDRMDLESTLNIAKAIKWEQKWTNKTTIAMGFKKMRTDQKIEDKKISTSTWSMESMMNFLLQLPKKTELWKENISIKLSSQTEQENLQNNS
jgi:hypothetical protein